MEPAATQSSHASYLDAVNEIFQTILLEQGHQMHLPDKQSDGLKISLSIKGKDKAAYHRLNIRLCSLTVACSKPVPFIRLLEEQCMPMLSQIICEMQAQEQESHLAVQTLDDGSRRLRKTTVLWLEIHPDTQSVVANIQCETVMERHTEDDACTVIQIRTLMEIQQLMELAKGVCDLMERIKFLHPKVQMSFSMNVGVLTELTLCGTESVSCGPHNIYRGPEVLIRNHASHFTCRSFQVKCSNPFTLESQAQEERTTSISVVCLTCFVPMSPSSCDENCCDINGSHRKLEKQYIPGHIRVSFFLNM